MSILVQQNPWDKLGAVWQWNAWLADPSKAPPAFKEPIEAMSIISQKMEKYRTAYVTLAKESKEAILKLHDRLVCCIVDWCLHANGRVNKPNCLSMARFLSGLSRDPEDPLGRVTQEPYCYVPSIEQMLEHIPVTLYKMNTQEGDSHKSLASLLNKQSKGFEPSEFGAQVLKNMTIPGYPLTTSHFSLRMTFRWQKEQIFPVIVTDNYHYRL
jgi:hypothetical protein